jgi:MFS family permease
MLDEDAASATSAGKPPKQRKIRTPWYALVAAPLMLTGTQSVVPALPSMRDDLGLTEAQVGLFMSAYFLPSIVLALPAGLLADRYGRRAVFTGGLVVFGTCGLVMTVFHESFTFLIAARAVQGAGFAAVLPLTMTLIADARVGGDQVKGQSHRSVAMKVGETLGPLFGGLLILITWYAPLALQSGALILAAVAYHQVPTGRTTGKSMGKSMGALLTQFKRLRFALLQSLAFFRFFFKFGFLTFLPLLAVDSGIMTDTESGGALTVSAAAALVIAAVMSKRSMKRPSSFMLGLNLVIVGVSLVMIGVADSVWLLVAGAIIFGLADSAVSIIYSAVITQAVEDDLRATFVAANGAIRNIGKFTAPVAVGLISVFASLATTFVVLGIASVVVGLSCGILREFDNLGSTKAD